MNILFDKEKFPFGEFGVTEDSIITGVAEYVVGLGYGRIEYRHVIHQVLEVYRDLNIIGEFRVNLYNDKIFTVTLEVGEKEETVYTFGPDGKPYTHREWPRYSYKLA